MLLKVANIKGASPIYKKHEMNESELDLVAGGKGWGGGAVRVVLGIIKLISTGIKASRKKN